ncbi:MAG: flagellar biosynthesis regulator FlaF [Alphaproteobacteria bacterium]|jgi:flagellar protein FlaF|nr:flagellar biosynthesis regulator FlaF [Alphaproteobacteria bacterium]
MNATELARQAYHPAQSALRTGRSAEAQLFGQITSRLQSAADTEPTDFARLAEALNENRQLWKVLAIDVADADNTLPAQLRAQIFYLAEFTFQHTSKVLKKDAEADVLIEINRAIMRGLNGAEATQ